METQENNATERKLAYPDVYTWVEHYLVYMYRRPMVPSRIAWCPQWWKHIEALTRLEALWRSWEYMRQENAMTGLARWWIELADPTMRALMDPDGTFKGCTDTQHKNRSPADQHLPFDPVPDEARIIAGA
ncbi:DUF4913 domain-containing protein [Arcanobacterium canis]